MGQKVNPIGFRLGIIKTWDSKWYAKADYAKLLHEDLKLRAFLKKRLYNSGVSKIEIERAANKAKINIFTARPGLIIGKKGSEVETLKKELAKLTDKEIYLNIQEVRKPELDAQLVAENVALAAGAADRVPSGHEKERDVSPQIRRQRDQDHLCRASGRRGNVTDRMVSRRAGAAPYPAGGYRLWDGRGENDLRHYRCQSPDLQR